MSAPALESALAEFMAALGHPGAEVSLLLAGDATLARFNATYRDREGPTDILSWRYGDLPTGGPLRGDLALSLDRARQQAGENGWDLPTEVLRLLAHGCAHLAGYDHQTEAEERKMRDVEVGLLQRVGLNDIYPAG